MSRPNILQVEAKRVVDDATVLIRVEELSLLAYGVFGNVYAGSLVMPTKERVVVKKTWARDSKLLPEIRILRILNSENYRNIVFLFYVFVREHANDRRCYGLIFERLNLSMSDYVRKYRSDTTYMLEMIDIKLFIWQLFNAQDHLAKHKICHRDIKPDNLFVNVDDGMLKMGDFGSSVILTEGLCSSDYYQVTRYYRPPELLLEANSYGTNVDVWSCGCVFGELLRGSVLMRGTSSFSQYEIIIKHLGYPTEEDMLAMKCQEDLFSEDALSNAILKFNKCNGFSSVLSHAPPDALRLLSEILVYNPQRRLKGSRLLNDPFFDDIFKPGAKRLGNKIVGIFNARDYAAMAMRNSRTNLI